MMKRTPLLLSVALLTLGALSASATPLPGPEVGDKAPDFTLKDANGANVNLAGLLKEGPVALVFYRSADWCPFCQKHLIELQSGLADIKAAGVQLVGISYDQPEALKRFSSKQGIAFPLLSDPDSETIKAYGLLNSGASGKAEGVPHPVTLLVAGDGTISAKLGFEGYRQRHTSKDLVEKARALAATKKP